MGIPAHMWLNDDGGASIRGSSSVQGREGSIEVIGFAHGLNLPIDPNVGKITGVRAHSPMVIEKEFDAASPYLYKAVSKGRLRQALLQTTTIAAGASSIRAYGWIEVIANGNACP